MLIRLFSHQNTLRKGRQILPVNNVEFQNIHFSYLRLPVTIPGGSIRDLKNKILFRLILWSWVFAFIMHCTTCMPSAQGCQKRVSGALERVTDNCELPCGRWELNLGPLTRAATFLTAKSFLQPLMENCFTTFRVCEYVCVCVRVHARTCIYAPQEHVQQDLHVGAREQL